MDGVLLLVDSSEGLPQTRFVLKKALNKNLPVILVINKIDRSDARINEVVNEVYDLFIDLDANDKQIDFPIIYTNAKDGVAHVELDDSSTNLEPLFSLILSCFHGPEANDEESPQFLITNLDYDPYVGQIAVGRLGNGVLQMNKRYSLCKGDGIVHDQKFFCMLYIWGFKKLRWIR